MNFSLPGLYPQGIFVLNPELDCKGYRIFQAGEFKDKEIPPPTIGILKYPNAHIICATPVTMCM